MLNVHTDHNEWLYFVQLWLQSEQVTVTTLTRCNIYLPACTVLNELKPRKVQGRVSCCSCCCASLARQRSSASPQTKLTRPPVIKQVYFPLGSPFPSYNPHSACLYPFLLSLLPSTRDGAIFILININECCFVRCETHTHTYCMYAHKCCWQEMLLLGQAVAFTYQCKCTHICLLKSTDKHAKMMKDTGAAAVKHSVRRVLCTTHTHTY